MDPWLEHPALWPDVHNRLVAALGDAITPLVAPRYFLALERRTYTLVGDDLVLVGRPDLVVTQPDTTRPEVARAAAGATVVQVAMPAVDEVTETFLEVRDAKTGTAITVIELLSPANKSHRAGRDDYLQKRAHICRTRTNLIEIDLLRSGEPMPFATPIPHRDYRILISRGATRPRADLYLFGIRERIPDLPVPLTARDPEPTVDLNAVWQATYDRARFDLRIDYAEEPVPPLLDADRQWARERIAGNR